MLLARLSVAFRIGSVDGRANVLEHRVELLVCGVQVVEDPLKGGRSFDVVADAQQKPMREVDEDRDFVEVVRALGIVRALARRS